MGSSEAQRGTVGKTGKLDELQRTVEESENKMSKQTKEFDCFFTDENKDKKIWG